MTWRLLTVLLILALPGIAAAESVEVRPGGNHSAPGRIGKTARTIIKNGKDGTQEIVIIPFYMGLRGPSVRLIRSDIERTLAHQGSPEEIWRSAAFGTKAEKPQRRNDFFFREFRLVLDNRLAWDKAGGGAQYRSSIVTGSRGPDFFGILDTGYMFRFNVADNLDHHPGKVRGDTAGFADNAIGLDSLYAAWTDSFGDGLHMALVAGYPEEMFGGFGGEILWRPFDSRLALGAETWRVWKRDPDTILNAGFSGYDTLSGHVNAWYDLSGGFTLQGRFGRYLAEDTGGTINLARHFRNGMTLEGYATVTNREDRDFFGDSSHIAQGLLLKVPLGRYKHVPEGISVRFAAEPSTREAGQAIASPVPLYETTEPFSKRHMIAYWDEITP